MKFTPRKIRTFLKVGMQVTVKNAVDVYRPCGEKGITMTPGEFGIVKDIKCPVVRITPGKRRPHDEFVSVEVIKEIDGRWRKRRVAVSYDNIELLGIFEYLSMQAIEQVVADMDSLNAHGLSWSGIYETYITIKYTSSDGTKEEMRYDLHAKRD